MKSRFAIFDVDYTLIKGDSMLLMLLFGIKKKPLIIFYMPIILIKIILSLLGFIDRMVAKEAIYIPLKYLNEEELEEFYNKVLLDKINIEVMTCLKEHKEEGYHVLLVSASAEIYLKFFENNICIDGVIGTKIKKVNGRYINKIEGENCKEHEKIKRINQYLEERKLQIDYNKSFAYSDSISDKPMLSLVKNKYKVDKRLGTIGEFIYI